MTPSGEEFVYTVTNDQAKKVYIETGMTYNDEVEVLKGLNGNDLLINKGARSIKDGDPVQREE
jgi:multidrug efflux pump subunit AcrA (membrane-fusion protein)